jgi:IS1 family transposase
MGSVLIWILLLFTCLLPARSFGDDRRDGGESQVQVFQRGSVHFQGERFVASAGFRSMQVIYGGSIVGGILVERGSVSHHYDDLCCEHPRLGSLVLENGGATRFDIAGRSIDGEAINGRFAGEDRLPDLPYLTDLVAHARSFGGRAEFSGDAVDIDSRKSEHAHRWHLPNIFHFDFDCDVRPVFIVSKRAVQGCLEGEPRALGVDEGGKIGCSGPSMSGSRRRRVLATHCANSGSLRHFLRRLSRLSECCRLTRSVPNEFGGLRPGVLHLSDLALHRSQLPSHDGSLRLDCLEGTERGCYAKHANNRKQSREDDVRLFPSRSGLLDDDRYLFMGIVWLLCLPLLGLGFYRVLEGQYRRGWILVCGGVLLDGLAVSVGLIGCLPWHWRRCLQDDVDHSKREHVHGGTIVLQKYLDKLYSCSTVIDMANVLSADKQNAIIGALAEGSSIRSIERITGVHRDTIMRLGVKLGQGCAALLDEKMRNLPCNRLEMDEIWGFVGKKDRNVREGEDAVGSVWTFCAIDAETKLVPAFKVGNRDVATATAFVQDVANRMAYRVQISTDGLNAYVAAMENAFGGAVDYAQIIKTYGHEEVSNNRRYSAPEFVSSEKKVVVGNPDERLISTSYVERLNATTRLHMRRLTRLTLAFSKKRENFEAAVALHFAYYNFVKRHSTIRCTPAMAAGVASSFWSVGDLVEAAA